MFTEQPTIPPTGITQTAGRFDFTASDELPDVPVKELADGWYLVSPNGYFWGGIPTLEQLDHEAFTGGGPGGPTLEAGPDDWFVEITGGGYGPQAYRPVAGSTPQVYTPVMGWLTCRYLYEAPGDDGMEPYYRCTVHGGITIGHQVSCEHADAKLRTHERPMTDTRPASAPKPGSTTTPSTSILKVRRPGMRPTLWRRCPPSTATSS